MNTRNARRIRSGLKAYALAECFRGYITFPTALKHHRRKLTSMAALKAFDYAHDRADWREAQARYAVYLEGLRIDVEFANIVNRNFQETP